MRDLTAGDLGLPFVAVVWNSERFDGRNLALRLPGYRMPSTKPARLMRLRSPRSDRARLASVLPLAASHRAVAWAVALVAL